MTDGNAFLKSSCAMYPEPLSDSFCYLYITSIAV